VRRPVLGPRGSTKDDRYRDRISSRHDLLRAVELRNTERDTFLSDLCGDDVALRNRVDELLRDSDATNLVRTTMFRRAAD